MPGSVVSTRSMRRPRFRGTVGDDDHPGVEAHADPDAAAVMNAHPARAGRHVDERIEDRQSAIASEPSRIDSVSR